MSAAIDIRNQFEALLRALSGFADKVSRRKIDVYEKDEASCVLGLQKTSRECLETAEREQALVVTIAATAPSGTHIEDYLVELGLTFERGVETARQAGAFAKHYPCKSQELIEAAPDAPNTNGVLTQIYTVEYHEDI